MGRRSAGRTWRERQRFTLLQQEVSPEKKEREQDGEVVSRQDMEGKTALHLAAARGESREDGEGTGWGGGQQAEHRGKDSASPCCSKSQVVSPGKMKREQDGEAVSRQNMEGKTALHLAAARGETREDREGTGWGGSQQAKHGWKDSASPCCSKR